MEIQGSVSVVTGASSGIGRSTALALARRGSTVLVTARRKDRLDDLVSFIRSRGGVAEAIPCDVTEPSRIADLARTALERFERCDILINNAGIPAGAPFLELSLDQMRLVIDTNLMGVVWGSRAFLPAMLKQGRGHILNVASLAGRHAVPGSALYSATKHAVVGFSESMNHETASRGVLVTAVNPGFVDTEGFPQKDLPDAIVMRPEKVARAICRAIERGRAPEISVPRSAGALDIFRTLAPGPYRWALDRAAGQRRR
jgi:uncharacterized protein